MNLHKIICTAVMSSDDECKKAYDYFDDGLPGDPMDCINKWAVEGKGTSEILRGILTFAGPALNASPLVLLYFAQAIEHAVRKSRS